ncbi:MAG TPA: ABC transporter permease, partial [Candidatus Hydrogenedentes bacterium]|nr:ABC transporter permease [Candidatus Hydrogenedentota bacterium]
MAVLPRDEVARLYVKEIALLRNALMIVAVLVVVVSIVSLAVNLYMSVLQRKRDIAVMRSLGAGSSDIFGVVLCESGALTTVALLAGSLTGHLAAWLLGMELANRSGVVIQAFSIQAGELTSYALVLAAALTAAVIPAMRSYRTDIALDLAEE